jgi:hypothetical protein
MARQPDLFTIPRSAPSLMELRARREALLRGIVRSWPSDTEIDAESDGLEAVILSGNAWQWLKRSAAPARVTERLMEDIQAARRLHLEIARMETAALLGSRRAVQR